MACGLVWAVAHGGKSTFVVEIVSAGVQLKGLEQYARMQRRWNKGTPMAGAGESHVTPE
ncbi:hypothetical protein GCM10017708_30060 [Arthrobacter citreus]